MSDLVRFTETELLSVILNEFKCKSSVEKSNSHIAAHKLALSIAQSDRNCRLDV